MEGERDGGGFGDFSTPFFCGLPSCSFFSELNALCKTCPLITTQIFMFLQHGKLLPSTNLAAKLAYLAAKFDVGIRYWQNK